MMPKLLCAWVGCVCVLAANSVCAQQADAGAAVPRLVKFSGVVKDRRGEALTAGVVTLSFSIYESQEGGAALWAEKQAVELDEQGRYTVLLGATHSAGLSLELFPSGQARWLGVAVEGGEEQPRVLLVSVPYALKAEEAEKLGGKRASDFVLAEKLKEEVKTAVAVEVQQVGEKSSEQAAEKGPQPLTGAEGPTDFSGSNSTRIVSVTQTGTGKAVHALIQNAASGAQAVRGETNATAGMGVFGYATATTGTAIGVRGQSDSPTGIGVAGYLSAATGYNYALSGISASAQGRGVLAQATSTTGTTIGFLAQVSSPSGVAGTFRNTASGKIITGEVGAGPVTQVFSVDGSGNIVGAGTVKGTRLISTVTTGTAPLTVSSTTAVTNLNADLLDGLHASSFATLGANIFVGNQSITGNVTGSGTGGFTGGLTVGTDFLVAANGRTTTPSVSVQLPNASSQGTVLNKPAILTGSPSTVGFTNFYTGGLVGIVTGGAGNTGNAQVALAGKVDCDFDGPTTAGDYVIFAPTSATGGCHDAGPALPPIGQVLGRVLTTNGGAGTYPILMYGPEQRAPSVTDNLLFHASFANTTQNNTGSATVIPRDGFVTLSTGTTSNSVADIQNQYLAGLMDGLNRAFMSARVHWRDAVAPQHIFYVLAGGHSGGVPLAAGMGFKAVGTALKGFTSDANSGMATEVDLGTTLTMGTFVDVLAVRRYGAVDFYVNGLLKGTSTTNLPGGSNSTYELRVENGASGTNAVLEVGLLTVGIKMFCSGAGCAY